MIAVVLGAAAIAAYLWGVTQYDRRFPQRRYSVLRITGFVCGAALLTAALAPPFDRAADASFAAHMIQHIILWLVAPPLMLLGAPLLLLVTVPPVGAVRRMTAFANSHAGRALFSPLTAWLAFVFVLWAAHFSPLYESALTYPLVHAFEHALFLFVAFLFWGAVVQAGYAPHPVSYPVRMFYLFFSIPQGAFLGFALGASGHVLYGHYLAGFGSAAAALADQRNGADLMWVLGGFVLFIAFMCTAGVWASSERGTAAAS